MLCQKLSANTLFEVAPKQGMYFSLYNIALDLNSAEAALFLLRDNKQILIVDLSRAAGGTRSISLSLEFDNTARFGLLSKGGSVHIIGGYKKCQGSNLQAPQARQHEMKPELPNQVQLKAQRPRRNIERKQVVQENPIAQTENQPSLRRSTRARAPQQPVNAKTTKKQKQHLKHMAKYFDCDLDDEDDSFSQQGEEDDDDDEDDEDNGKNNKQDDGSSSSEDSEEDEKTNQCRKIRIKTEQPAHQDAKSSTKQSQNPPNFPVPTRNPYK